MKITKNTMQNQKKLRSYNKIYTVAYCPNICVVENIFSEKYVRHNEVDIPLVYSYNKELDNYMLTPLTKSIKGIIVSWTLNRSVAYSEMKRLSSQ